MSNHEARANWVSLWRIELGSHRSRWLRRVFDATAGLYVVMLIAVCVPSHRVLGYRESSDVGNTAEAHSLVGDFAAVLLPIIVWTCAYGWLRPHITRQLIWAVVAAVFSCASSFFVLVCFLAVHLFQRTDAMAPEYFGMIAALAGTVLALPTLGFAIWLFVRERRERFPLGPTGMPTARAVET